MFNTAPLRKTAKDVTEAETVPLVILWDSSYSSMIPLPRNVFLNASLGSFPAHRMLTTNTYSRKQKQIVAWVMRRPDGNRTSPSSWKTESTQWRPAAVLRQEKTSKQLPKAEIGLDSMDSLNLNQLQMLRMILTFALKSWGVFFHLFAFYFICVYVSR